MKKNNSIKIFGAISIVTLLLSVAFLAFIFVSNREDTSKNKVLLQAINILGQKGTVPKEQAIISSLGFSLFYDTNTFDSYGQVTAPSSDSKKVQGEYFENNDLSKERPYSIVKLRLKDSNKSKYVSLSAPELVVLTNIRKDYFENRKTLPEYQGLSLLEIWTKVIDASKKESGYDVSSKSDIVINNIKYKKVVYENKVRVFDQETIYKDIVYFTVQNDRPYYVAINNAGFDSNRAAIPLFESVIKNINYKTLDKKSLSINAGKNIVLAQASTPAKTANVPYPLDPATVLDVAARNQPSTVRIGMSYCASMKLLLPNGSTGTSINKGCILAVGSGTFISSDGYIATNGHVVLQTVPSAITYYVLNAPSPEAFNDRVLQMLRFFVDSNIMTEEAADIFVTGFNNREQQAVDLLMKFGEMVPKDRISDLKEDYEYQIQLSDTPLSYDKTNYKFKNGPMLLPAALIGYDFNPNKTLGNADNSDIAILKTEGNFPIVELGSVNSVNNGNTVTAIGFPAFVDGGFFTTSTRTYPSLTQGKITKIDRSDFDGSGRHTLLYTNVPIAPGNSGGPLFNNAGAQIGLNTYSIMECPDKNCFGNGIARDIDDLKKLISNKSISIKQSKISESWIAGISALKREDFKTAVEQFKIVQKDYPANYLAADFIQLASSMLNPEQGKSPSPSAEPFENNTEPTPSAVPVVPFENNTEPTPSAVPVVPFENNTEPTPSAVPVVPFENNTEPTPSAVPVVPDVPGNLNKEEQNENQPKPDQKTVYTFPKKDNEGPKSVLDTSTSSSLVPFAIGSLLISITSATVSIVIFVRYRRQLKKIQGSTLNYPSEILHTTQDLTSIRSPQTPSRPQEPSLENQDNHPIYPPVSVVSTNDAQKIYPNTTPLNQTTPPQNEQPEHPKSNTQN